MNAGDNTYLIDDEALCDEFDFLNNVTDNDDSLSSEGTRCVYCGHILFTITVYTPCPEKNGPPKHVKITL